MIQIVKTAVDQLLKKYTFYRSGQLILGEVSSISLSITIQNKGEPAYLSELFIFLPPDMPSINQDFCASSGQSNNASLICDLGNPLLENGEVVFLD